MTKTAPSTAAVCKTPPVCNVCTAGILLLLCDLLVLECALATTQKLIQLKIEGRKKSRCLKKTAHRRAIPSSSVESDVFQTEQKIIQFNN